MKKKFISLFLAFLMIVTALPLSALAQNAGPASEELEKLDYQYERIGGQGNIKITLPANSVEIKEDPYAMRLMSITDNVPDQGGAGHLINWGTGVVWNVYDKNDPNKLAPFPPAGKKPYEVKLMKTLNGERVVIGKATVNTATEFADDIKPDKSTTYQFVTTENYEVGDENKELSVEFPAELDMNLLYQVAQTSDKGTIGDNHKYNLIFLVVTRLTSPTYTAEWDKTPGALQPNIKGKLITGINKEATVDVFKEDGKYGTICNKPPIAYVDEKDKAGNLIGEIRYDKRGSLDIKSVLWSKGSTPVMKGQFLSYETSNFDTSSFNTTKTDRPLGNKKGMIPAHYAKTADGVGKDKTPAYFYNLVGDNDHMWRFQMKEGLELKFNTGVGSATQGGQTGQDIGNTQTVAYGEKFDSALKGSFSEKTLTLPETTNLVAPSLNKNNLKMKFIGWKLVEGLEVPVNPQKVETDGEGKQTLTAVTPDYADKAALETALKAADFKGFTEKNPVFYAIYGQTQGKANIKYVDDKGTELAEDLKIQGQDYKTEKLGELNEAVTANINEAPQFKDYAISKVEIEPTTDAKYVDPATATIKFVYKAKATTDDKSSDTDYIKVTFDANEGHFETTSDTTKDVYVLKDKATFADAKGKVSNPTKDNAFFKEWQTAATGGTKVADDKTLSAANETFYANYTTKAQGKASVEYLDVKTGQAIADTFKVDGAEYPAEKEGNQGAKIPADIITKTTAPKFVGYEFNRVEISPKDGTYALPATSTVKVYYNKLADVVPGTGNTKPDGYATVKFEPGTNGILTGETTFYVNPKAAKTNADITEPTIKANTGFKVADPKWNPKFDKASTTAITADATYTAQYTEIKDVVNGHDENDNVVPKPDGYKTVTFDLDGKGTTTNETVFYVNPTKEVTLTAPKVTGIKGYTIKAGDEAWNPKFVALATYAEDKTFVAQYTFEQSVVPQKPGEEKPVVPDNFVKVEFKKGDHGVISSEETTIYWVDPSKEVTVTAPKVIADKDYKHTGWDKALTAKFDKATDITALYKKLVVPGPDQPTKPDPNNPGGTIPDPDYVKVEFLPGDHGKFEKVDVAGANGSTEKKDQVTVFWVLKDEKASFNAPKATPDANYKFKAWNPAIQETYSEAVTTHTATYEAIQNVSDTPVAGFNKVTFKPGTDGKFEGTEQEKSVWVRPDTLVDLKDKAPTVIPNKDYSHTGWEPGLVGKFADGAVLVAQYSKSISEVPVPGWTEILFNSGEYGRFADGNKNVRWVDPKVEVKLDFMTGKIVPYINYSFVNWKAKDNSLTDLKTPKKYEKDTFFTGTYKSDISNTPEAGKVEINFKPGTNGKFADGAKTKIYVTKGKLVDLTEFAPTVIPNQGYGHSGWEPALKGTFTQATDITAQYVKGTFKADELESIDVFGPKKLSYKEGEKLNLDGLKIVVKDKAGIQETYDGVQAITAAGFTIAPANETPLIIKDHNGQPIKVSKEITEGQTKKTVEGQTVSTLSVSMNKSAVPTDVLARNLGKDPKKTTVTGKAPEGSVIKVTDIDGNDLTDGTKVKAGANGEFTATLKDKLEPGTPVKVTSTEPGKTESSPVVKQVFEDVNKDGKPDEQTPTPTIVFAANQNTVGSDGTTPTQTPKDTTTLKFTVKNKPTKVFVKYTDNGVAKEESFNIGANDDATKTVELGVKLPVGAEVQVLAKDADKTLSEPATEKVVRDSNNDGKADDKKPLEKAKIDDIKAGADKILVTPPKGATELVISERDKNGDTPQGSTPVTLTKDGSTWKTSDGKAVTVENGKLAIPKGTFKLDEYNVVEAEAKGDPDTTTPSKAYKTVGEAADTKAPAKPVVDPPIAGDENVKVKTPTEPDAKTITVEITKKPAAPGEDPTKETVVVTKDGDKWKTPDGTEVPEENGKLVIPVPEVKTGDTVTVTVADDSKNTSEPDTQTVVERQKLDSPVINPIKIGDKLVTGTALTNKDKPNQFAASTVDIYKKVGNDYKLLKEGVGVNSDGSYTYNQTEAFKDGEVIRVVANKPGMTSSAAETTVGVDTTALDKAIQDGKDALDPDKGGKNDGTPEDEKLKEAIKEGEDLKKKDPAPTQEEVNDAKDKIEKAIEEKKKADEDIQKLKDKIKEGEDRLKQDDIKDKPKQDVDDLKKAVEDGKKALETKDNKTVTDATKVIEKAIDQINKERIVVGVNSLAVGAKTLEIKTSVPRAKVVIKIDGKTIHTITTDPYGTFSQGLLEGLEENQQVILEASKPGYNDGSFVDTVY